MWTRGYPVEIESNSTEAIMYVNPPSWPKPGPATSWKVNDETDAVEQVRARCNRKFSMTCQASFVDFIQEECFHHWVECRKRSLNVVINMWGRLAALYHVVTYGVAHDPGLTGLSRDMCVHVIAAVESIQWMQRCASRRPVSN
ncbi:unnamed protein product [Diatraea saccharalis]|uniref:Uncharacterized protein n=1 Tax=Diatraea saccharalis TaxID=40085 RepID=A0A9N9WEU8_9NEOP|nr:unnamed protein product [Diatraea saccharalis]